MKQIDGLVTKDEIYRLISGFRTRFKISEEAGHEMAKRVAEMPTIEEKPVKHGRWIKHRIDDPKSILYGAVKDTTCSICGNSTPYNTEYCMHCGARMDNGDDEL